MLTVVCWHGAVHYSCEKKAQNEAVLCGAGALLALSCAATVGVAKTCWPPGYAVFLFMAFNLLEASLPSLLCKGRQRPARLRRWGVSTSQFFMGAFWRALGGYCYNRLA